MPYHSQRHLVERVLKEYNEWTANISVEVRRVCMTEGRSSLGHLEIRCQEAFPRSRLYR